MIHSDWHNHSRASYDAELTLEELSAAADQFDFRKMGITDHLNYNDQSFLQDMDRSARDFAGARDKFPKLVLGVELTPIAGPEFDYIQKTGTREGYVPGPWDGRPYEIKLGLTKEELMALGVSYGIGASHWRVDIPDRRSAPLDLDKNIREWYRQQLFLAQDARVTVLGHPWYHYKGLWYEDFSVIDPLMNREIGAALKENGKYAECNAGFLKAKDMSEKFRYQYVQFLREWHEMGIPIVYGSDSHNSYDKNHLWLTPYLASVGFKDGDIVEIAEKDLWQ